MLTFTFICFCQSYPVNNLIHCITGIRTQNRNFFNKSNSPEAADWHLLTPPLVKPCQHIRNLGMIVDADLSKLSKAHF